MGTDPKKLKTRETIFWIGTGISLLIGVVMPLMRQPNAATAATVMASFTFFTVLSLYTGQRAIDAELDSRYADLLAALNANAATDRIKALLKDIRANRPELFHSVAENAVRHLEDQLQGAAVGTMTVPDEERIALPLRLARTVEKTLDTTAFFANDPTTSEYHASLAEAASTRHVKIRRLFLIKTGTESQPGFKARVAKDAGAKVEVRYRFLENWIASSVAREPVDIGIWDRQMIWIYTDNTEIHSDRMHPRMIHGEPVALYQKTFDQNWERAVVPPAEWLQG